MGLPGPFTSTINLKEGISAQVFGTMYETLDKHVQMMDINQLFPLCLAIKTAGRDAEGKSIKKMQGKDAQG